ncbi:hypothetical protein AHF37_03047 [Paragonimus kellicotti]|nr:hypothetical protein AHF37_03047 [Paragonimus kellicotti]
MMSIPHRLASHAVVELDNIGPERHGCAIVATPHPCVRFNAMTKAGTTLQNELGLGQSVNNNKNLETESKMTPVGRSELILHTISINNNSRHK